MIRQPEREQLNRLTAKTLDQMFIMRVKEGLSCSQFEAEALTDLVKEVYFPWLAQPAWLLPKEWGLFSAAIPTAQTPTGRSPRRVKLASIGTEGSSIHTERPTLETTFGITSPGSGTRPPMQTTRISMAGWKLPIRLRGRTSRS